MVIFFVLLLVLLLIIFRLLGKNTRLNKAVTFIIFLVIMNLGMSAEMIRELKLKVVDAKTKEPLKNIVVYYQIYVDYISNVIGDTQSKDIELKKYVTDENGEVVIKKHNHCCP